MDISSRNQTRLDTPAVNPQSPPDSALEQTNQRRIVQARTTQPFELVGESPPRGPGLPSVAWNPAPRIPGMILEPDIAQLMTADQLGKSQDEQLKTLLSNLKSASENLDEVNKKKMDKLHQRMNKVLEQIKKQEEAKLAGDVTFGLSIAASILSVIGAALLTFVSLGAAAPALIGAVIGATTTIMDGIDRGLQAGGVKYESGPLKGKQATASLTGLVSAAWEAIMVSSPEFNALSKEEQGKRISGMQIAVAVGMSVFLLGAGIAAGAGGVMRAASDGVKVASTLSATMGRLAANVVGKGAEMVQIATELANSVGTMSTAVMGVQLANITFESNELDNQRQFFEAMAEAVQRLISSNQESLESIQESIAEFVQNVSESNASYYSTSNDIGAMREISSRNKV